MSARGQGAVDPDLVEHLVEVGGRAPKEPEDMTSEELVSALRAEVERKEIQRRMAVANASDHRRSAEAACAILDRVRERVYPYRSDNPDDPPKQPQPDRYYEGAGDLADAVLSVLDG